MNYKEKIILSNKHHISSARYHLQRVMPDNKGEKPVIGLQDLKTIREQLKLWERDLYLLIDCS